MAGGPPCSAGTPGAQIPTLTYGSAGRINKVQENSGRQIRREIKGGQLGEKVGKKLGEKVGEKTGEKVGDIHKLNLCLCFGGLWPRL